MPLTSTERSQRRRSALAAVATEHGYGNYSELLTAVLNGDAAVVRIVNDYDPAGPEMAAMRRMAEAAHPYTRELLEAVIRSLELALVRRYELRVD